MDAHRELFETRTEQGQVVGYAMARRDDPVTSHEAAAKHVATGKADPNRRLCLAVVAEHPGRTSAEIAELAGLSRHEAARRLPELRKDGLVRNGGKRVCSVTKNQSLTWFRR